MSSETVLSSSEKKPRLLCVDDEPQVLAGLQDTLHRRFDLTVATSGREGLELIRSRPPFAIVVSDFAMPEMDGARFLSQVRVVSPDSVRVLLTGQASLNGAMAAVNEGNIFRFLSKPCPPSVLLQALEDALEQSRLVTQDRELIERKLQKMSGHLLRAERLASLGTMSAAVAHELNNMLMVFNGGLSALRSDAAAGKVANLEDLELLEEVRGRIARHASHLLHLGRVPQSESTTADVGLVVLATLEMLRVGGALRRTRIDLDLPETSVEVRLGKTELEQVVLNLVKNAAEALAEMGKPDASITVTVRRGEGSAATCSIADNGPGIAARDLQLIFEPYFTTKSPERGTGLGLFVVRQICRDAGGDVVVSSTPGEGTKFTLSLPVA